ncbi:hypothetical protein E24_00091 [Faustovirus]|nr:hypothetical protein PRJ_Fausto_00082 [Faustovirus]AMN83024.1 hypothetical protein E24_00091 [Faustovirus]AMN84009.1 hypothetical protein D5a_00091 [Faustovirus]AMN84994.1 hypothetical protein E23_00091 [Faustovirus]QBR98996.1 hypothetical protein [Faustovirus mariensis]
MNECVFPNDIIKLIAVCKLQAYVKLRECCTVYRRLLPIESQLAIKFNLKPTLVYNFDIKRLVSRPAICYTIVGSYIIKLVSLSFNLFHVKIFTKGRKVVDLTPKMLITGRSIDEWKHPNTVEGIITPISHVFKYYDREHDGLICRLILNINRVSEICKYTIWYDNNYHVVEYNRKSKVIAEYKESSIPEYYPPRIMPNQVITME